MRLVCLNCGLVVEWRLAVGNWQLASSDWEETDVGAPGMAKRYGGV